MIWNSITEFYDDLFQYHYEKQKKLDSDPEAFPTFIISLCQGANLILILIIFYYTTNLNAIVGKQFIPYSIIGLYLILAGINTYRYTFKNKAEKIIKRNKTVNRKMRLFSNIYILISIWFPLFLIYFFKEIY